ncbi:DNA polymerase I [Sandaracinus amylolyticus]|uniref:DNA polymerase I n=1 Tax=Sandaracinus amylolyticus TaxID=927083 RepID=UPI001EFFC7B9|nr:DNA polymerase I [Sandaracinus amylolyticus]UJR82027.1 DNA polymerase I [Sandaracinus amylolyticus]
MARTERLVLVDGSWLVFRAFFGLPSNLATRTGLHTNATFGFATMFRKLFSGRMPDRGAVVFDAPGATVREEKFPQYKAQRPPIAGELREQLAWIDRVVSANHFPMLRVPGYEADDVIATLAKRGLEMGMEVVIVAGDKDLAQMVREGIRMQDTMKDVVYDAELVRKKWGVPPQRIPDLLALMGDNVDNIPGVPGIGQKGAAQLLETYGSIDGILANVEQLKGKQKATLIEHAEEVKLYRELATIDPDVPLDVSLDALIIAPPDRTELDALYRELEFYSLLSGGDEARASDTTTSAVRCLGTLDAARAAMDALPRDRDVAVQPVFEPIAHVVRGDLVGLAFAATAGDPFYLPLTGQGACLGEEGLALVRPFFEDASRPKAVHDAKQLEILLRRENVTLRGDVFDTMLASFLVEPNKCIPHRLDQVAKEYVQRGVPPLKSLVGSGQKERKPSEATCEEAASWAGQLADVVLALAPVLRERLEKEGQRGVYEKVERPLSSVLASMELAGIRVDQADLGAMSEEFKARKAEIEQRIYALAGHEFNIGSTKQLADVLFEELKLPVVKKTKTGYSTDAEVLERLAPKHEIARLILQQRELAKLINTYTDVLREAVSPETGRVHASFLQTTGVSGRLITTDPDLQRTPVRTPEGKRIRKAFVAPEGTVLIAADWSQIELRVLAQFSDDARLLEAFRENLDLHRRTASLLFSIAPEDVTSEQRNIGKTVNFATIYGQGATALGQILGIPRKDAQRYIEQYFEHYAGVRAWLDRTIARAHETGYVETLLGRRRYIPELSSLNSTDRATGERIAANTPIQGSAADLCKLAMLAIARRLPEVAPSTRMLLQVHDELVFEAPPAEVELASAVIRGEMERPWSDLRVPLVVEIGVGRSWGEAK